jgi:molecular chaperone DnaK
VQHPGSTSTPPTLRGGAGAALPMLRSRMGYRLAVDLGTTYTAATRWRDGDARPEVVTLGSRAAAMPSVVFVDADGSVLVGDAADARAVDEPSRVAREFKRRLGDPAPVLVGGSPWAPEALMAQLLRAVVARATSVEGGGPASITLTHPATWGPYKLEQFRQVARLADVTVPTAFVAEPVAAAAHYATTERVPAGTVVAVYDLGGGTFDATVLRVGVDGAAVVLGVPEGIDRFGGIDVDAAVFEHVQAHVPHLFAGLDPDDPVTGAVLAQVRSSCRLAKEALSDDTQASIVVALPAGAAQVRLTRSELEAAIRPQLAQTIGATQRAVRSAGLTDADVDRVLLVGGASRTPAIAETVAGSLGRPVAVDADPKHAVALGAALVAAAPVTPPAPAPEPVAPAPPPPVVAPTAAPEIPVEPAAPQTGRRRTAVLIGGLGLAVAAVVAAFVAWPTGSDGGSDGDGDAATEGVLAGAGVGLAAAGGVTLDDGRVLVADTDNHRVIAIDQDGVATTIAGTGGRGGAGDGGQATAAQLADPGGVALLPDGRVLVADTGNHRLRVIDADGTIRAFAGDGRSGFVGDGGPPADARFAFPQGVSVADDSRILVADTGNDRVRVIDADHATITTLAGTNVNGFSGDGGPAIEAHLDQPQAAVALGDRVVIADGENNRIRVVDAGGAISTIAGIGSAGDAGDGGSAVAAQLHFPRDLAAYGNQILVVDTGSGRVRAIDPGGSIETLVEAVELGSAAPLAIAVEDDRVVVTTDDGEVVAFVP